MRSFLAELGHELHVFASNDLIKESQYKGYQVAVIAASDDEVLKESINLDKYFCGTPEQLLSHIEDHADYFKNNEFIIKPSDSRGSRGFRHVVPNHLMQEYYFSEKFFATISFDMCLDLLGSLDSDAQILIQDYYAGDSYSVDCYTDKTGKVHITPSMRSRSGLRWGQLQECEVLYTDDVQDYAERLAKLFKFDNHFHFEFNRDLEGNIKMIEINPRLSGGLCFTLFSPHDILHKSFSDFLDIEAPSMDVKRDYKYFCYFQNGYKYI